MTTRRHRVAHILPYPGVGGTEHATLRVVQAAAAQGFANVAFCPADAPAVRAFFADAGVETAIWHARQPRAGQRLAFARRTTELALALRRRRIDIVHCADVPAASWGAAHAARLARLPVVCHIYNRHPWLENFNFPGLRLVDRFAFVSQATWREFALPVPPASGRVIYYGYPTAPPVEADETAQLRRTIADDLGIPADAGLVGMVARVEPQKDFATLIRAAARVLAVRPDTYFLIVGGTDGTEAQREHFPKVQQEIERLGVASRFVFAGFRRDVDRLLRALDVFVLSTHWEGLPLAVVEAMRQGRPVIATDVDGMQEVVRDGETGFLVPHEDAPALADRLLALLGDPALAGRLGAAGRRSAEVTFGEERFAGEIRDLYHEVLGTAGR